MTNIDGYDVEITGEEYTLLTRHYDKPGVVAKVCEELAKEKINISTMRLFRKGKGSDAVMIIHTDQPRASGSGGKSKEFQREHYLRHGFGYHLRRALWNTIL